MSNDCECLTPGYCQRYKRMMLGKMHEFCQGKGITEQQQVLLLSTLVETAKKVPDKEPNLLQKAISLGKAIVEQTAAGFPVVEDEVLKQRLGLCLICPEYNAKKGHCSKCGCSMRVKARWLTQECPIGKW